MQYVEIINAIELARGWKRHPQAKKWLHDWIRVTSAASWSSIVDVRKTYPSADGVTLGKGKSRYVVTIFNVGGNDYRLLTRINYTAGRVTIHSLLTHAEYNKQKWR